MPELPDVLAYVDALQRHVVGAMLERVIVPSPFILRTAEPAIDELEGAHLERITRLGKRFVLGFERDLHLVVHLMISGRWTWSTGAGAARSPVRGRHGPQLILRFDRGTLGIVEHAHNKRASVHVVRGGDALGAFERRGHDALSCTRDEFAGALTRQRRTLKRALTDPAMVDGIGNAYSDEILCAARLSPFKRTDQLDDDDMTRLFESTRRVLTRWIDELRAQFKGGEEFPKPAQITAFRPGFAVHGRFGKACPECGAPVQRVVLADREFNYCPGCQTGGRILADRSLSRLLRDEWPGTLDELDAT